MAVRSKVRSQPRIPGHRRHHVGTALSQRIDRAVEREMARYGVSRSFVIAIAVAFALGVNVDADEDYKRGR